MPLLRRPRISRSLLCSAGMATRRRPSWSRSGHQLATTSRGESRKDAELDRLARSYNVKPEERPLDRHKLPDGWRDLSGEGTSYRRGNSPWDRKSMRHFKLRWEPLRLYHGLKPLAASLDFNSCVFGSWTHPSGYLALPIHTLATHGGSICSGVSSRSKS